MTRLVLLHAATRDRHDFGALLSALPALADDALTLDLLGHGEAPRAARYSILDFAEAVAPVLGDGRFTLYGHSLGGLVGIALAARRPDRVAGLVLEDPPVFGSRMPRLADTSFYRGFKALKTLMEGPAAGWDVAQWEQEVAGWPSGHGRTTVAEVLGEDGVAMRARQLARLDPGVIGSLLAGDLHADFDIEAALRSLSCPAILLAGEAARNSALSPEDLCWLAEETALIVEPVAGEGHFIHETLPAPCATAVRAVIAASQS
jgi:pimeloyl-ACP methyl ester carboxylesterase